MNEILFIVEILTVFGAAVAAGKFFGKSGLTAFIAVALVLANITAAKTVDLFGLQMALGNVLFASTFLASDILTEKYGAKEARRAVILGVAFVLFFLLVSQLTLAFSPAASDLASPAMTALFGLNLRISLASVACCLLANLADIYIYEKLRRKTGGKHMWLRNNVATVIGNCGENFLFVFAAFAGVMPVEVCLSLAVGTCVFEAVLAACDTPFLYFSRWLDSRGY